MGYLLPDYAQQLLRQHLGNVLPTLLKAIMDVYKSPVVRKRALMIVWRKLSKVQQQKLLDQGRESLAEYLFSRVQSFKLQNHQGPSHPQSKAIKALLSKLLAEQAHHSLAWGLYLIAQNNNEGLNFAERLLWGLESDNICDQGNALEALSNCPRKQLTGLLLTIFDKPLDAEHSIMKMVSSLFEEQEERFGDDLDLSIYQKQSLAQETWRYWHRDLMSEEG